MYGAATAAAAATLMLYLYFSGGPARFSAATSDSGVLLVTIDTLRADHLGSYGRREIRTPVIDGLADNGVLFERAFTPAIMTLPSHASILTGTWPPTHGIRDNGDYRLNPESVTLAEVLRARGFSTAAVTGSFVLDSLFGLDQGFEIYDDMLPTRKPNETFFAERPAQAVTDAALRHLAGMKPGRFFLWVHYFDPHHPYVAPAQFAEQYPRSPYDAEIAYVDSEIGRLLAGMKTMGLRQRTLVVVVADHGEGLGDHGEESHGVFPYDEEMRVPLILSFPPHLPTGRRVKGVVRTVDIMPTILEILGVDPDGKATPAQGERLWSLMADEKSATAPGFPAYAEAMAPLLLYGWSPLFVLRDETHKYIEAPRPELYDMTADPREKNNLASSRPELVAGYKARLETLRQQVTRAGAGAETVAPDPETEAKLRSLGYVSGGAPPSPGAAALPDPKDMIDSLVRINRVYVAFGSGQFETAVREAREILSRSPDNKSVRFYMAGALTGLSRYDEAVAEYRKILERSPRDTEALSNLGWCLINMDQLDEAKKVFGRVLETHPDHIYATASLANVAFIEGDFREAMRLYKEVLRREPNHLTSIKTMAGIYEGMGKLEEAAVFYAQGVTVDPDNLELWMSLGWVKFQQGKLEDALAALQRARDLAPDAAELQAALGDVQYAMGNLADARTSYQLAIKAAPGLAAGYYGLGLIELKQGEAARALDLIARAVTLNPGKAAWREDLARALAATGRYEAAATELQRYLDSGQAPKERRNELQALMARYRAGRP